MHHNAAKTHCKRGHKFTEKNTYLRKKGNKTVRQCRTCSNDKVKEYRAKSEKRFDKSIFLTTREMQAILLYTNRGNLVCPFLIKSIEKIRKEYNERKKENK